MPRHRDLRVGFHNLGMRATNTCRHESPVHTPQVSFYRANLFLKVVKKPGGTTQDGKPADKQALVEYIRCGVLPCWLGPEGAACSLPAWCVLVPTMPCEEQ